MDDPKTFHVKSFGCQMNVYDGERMAELLEAQGMTAAGPGHEADLVVLNTCHIREKAAEKVYSDIGRLRRDDCNQAGCRAEQQAFHNLHINLQHPKRRHGSFHAACSP